MEANFPRPGAGRKEYYAPCGTETLVKRGLLYYNSIPPRGSRADEAKGVSPW